MSEDIKYENNTNTVDTSALLENAKDLIYSYQYFLNGYKTNDASGQIDQKLRKIGKNLSINIMNLVNSDSEKEYRKEIESIYRNSLQIITSMQSLSLSMVTDYGLSVNVAQLHLNMFFYNSESNQEENIIYIIDASRLIYQKLPRGINFNQSFIRFSERVKKSLFDAIRKTDIDVLNLLSEKIDKKIFEQLNFEFGKYMAYRD